MGFEPMNTGFANPRLGPLGYAASVECLIADQIRDVNRNGKSEIRFSSQEAGGRRKVLASSAPTGAQALSSGVYPAVPVVPTNPSPNGAQASSVARENVPYAPLGLGHSRGEIGSAG